jgi:hypothetical protein
MNSAPAPADRHSDSAHSSLRASILEHLFVGELLRFLWASGERSMQILRSEVDANGHDLVIICNGVTRFIQLKSSRNDAKTTKTTVHVGIAQQPDGCVIWLSFDRQMHLEYLWFGEPPGIPLSLSDTCGRHTRGSKAERPQTRVLKRSTFIRLNDVAELAQRLFGCNFNQTVEVC